MRKKLLRSRTGFEKPESREEAIMQNILGASNVLEPSESNIEEILKSILYNIPYTKEAEFEIEKILLAIKNNGTYDGEGESRDMKILIAILNDLDYTEEAESRIEELFIEWLHQRSQIKVLEGVPPLTFTSRGLPLINYLIEGNTVQNGTPTPSNPVEVNGVGDEINAWSGSWRQNTNLFSITENEGVFDVESTTSTGTNYFALNLNDTIPTDKITYFRITAQNGSSSLYSNGKFRICFRRVSNNSIFAGTQVNIGADGTYETSYNGSESVYASVIFCDANIAFSCEISNIVLSEGYKIPIVSGGVTTNIYIGDQPLRKSIDGSNVYDELSSSGTLIRRVDANGAAFPTPITETITAPSIPTTRGTATIDVDTTLKPSHVYIEYK